MKNHKMSLALVLFAALFLSGCADHTTFQAAMTTTPVGFWYGIWHGMILPISWLVSLFSDDVAIYAIYNTGGWYDFGFMWGAGILAAGSEGSLVTALTVKVSRALETSEFIAT